MTRTWTMVMALVLLGSAGCAEEPVPTVLTSDAAPPPEDLPEPAGEGLGHIAGFVMDDKYRTLEGVSVRLPTFDLNDTTDRKGEFSFVDLVPGAYAIEVKHPGYKPLHSVIDVPADGFARLHLVLRAVPPTEPRHVTHEFRHVALFTGEPFGFVRYSYPNIVEAEDGLHTMVIEAYMDDHQLGGMNGFRYALDARDCCVRYAEGEGPNAMRVVVPMDALESPKEQYRITVSPYGTPPEVDKEIEMFVTLFYHGPPPEGWAIGDA